MKRLPPLIRLPQSFLIFPLIMSLGGAIISGGVASSQASGGAGWANVDQTFFYWCCAATVFLVLFWRFGPIDWISDEEIKALERRELAAQLQDETGRTIFVFQTQFWVAATALYIGFRWTALLGGRGFLGREPLNLTAKTPNGGSGAAILGNSFGSFHILNRDWTGAELVIIIPLLIFLGVQLWKGFARIVRLNRRPR